MRRTLPSASNGAALSEVNPDELERQRQSERAVCEFCFRSFDSIALAEEHEVTNCPRNPNVSVQTDRFRLLTVYREIRPPLPLQAREILDE